MTQSDETSETNRDDSTAGPPCPVCEREVGPRDKNPTYPFCSKRCKQVDLGRWLNEDISIPISPQSTERNLPDEESDDEESR